MNGNKHSDNGRPRGVELRSEGMVSMAGGVPRRLLWLSAVVMAGRRGRGRGGCRAHVALTPGRATRINIGGRGR